MPYYDVEHSSLQGSICIPPSKSQTLRAILFAALADGTSTVHDYLPSPDISAMVSAIKSFGAEVECSPKKIEVKGLAGKIRMSEDVIHAGNSGIVLRFCTALGALAHRPVVITGDRSIRYQRPMAPLIEGLSKWGVAAVSMRGDGYAPIIVQGPIRPGLTSADGTDSQHISALLIAAAFAEGTSEIEVRNPGEIPWVALTLSWFERLGISCQQSDFQRYRIRGKSSYLGFDYHVPGDFSSAAFPLAAAIATRSTVTLNNLDMAEMQGDKELIAALRKMGAKITVDPSTKSITIDGRVPLQGMTADINNYIDAATILAVIACFAEGETVITNAQVARSKECDRIRCIVQELKKMGASIEERRDGFTVRGSRLHGADVESHDDHRMAMSLAIAGLAATGKTRIGNTGCVAKTFPHFVRDFKTLGARIEEIR